MQSPVDSLHGQQTSCLDIPIAESNDLPAEQKKKKKKRRHEDYQNEAEEGDGVKKRKRNEDHFSGNASAVDLTDDLSTTNGHSIEKRNKKDKGKEKTMDTLPEAQSQSPTGDFDANAQASAAALLTAILAAAATGASPEMFAASLDPNYQPDILSNGQSSYMSYPPMPAPYPNATDPLPASDPALFSNNMGLPFSELSSGSNDDILRALQDLDISKIAHVLKTLGDAAAAANVPSFPSFVDQTTAPPSLPPIGQVPVLSNAILGVPAKETARRQTIERGGKVPEQYGNPDHADLLANRWLNASKLAEMVKTEGLVYKKGKFSDIEEQNLRKAIELFRLERGYSHDQMLSIIFPRDEKSKDMQFWSTITSALPQRPIIAVYHHVRRTYHPLRQQGRWSPEEDALLAQAVADLGQQWEKVSLRVGRMSSDCRDRYRNHILNREIRVFGPWSIEEEDQLTRIVTDMTIKQGKDIDNDVFWGKVSELMGGKRGRQQCRIKWTDGLSKTIKNEGQKPRWSQQDAFILVHKVDSLNVLDDTEIDWKTLPDPDWNLWSAHTLQRRWLTMKRSIKGYESMTHAEIMDILRQKRAHLPPPPQSLKKRKERKVTSAAAISDADGSNRADTSQLGSEAPSESGHSNANPYQQGSDASSTGADSD